MEENVYGKGEGIVHRRADVYLLNIIHTVVFGGLYFVPLNLLDGDHDYLDGIGFLVVWIVDYNRRLRKEDYFVDRLSSPIWDKRDFWIPLWMPAVLGLLFGLLEGWGKLWQGVVLGLAFSAGHLLFRWVEFVYIRKFAKKKSGPESPMSGL